ncbi:hypothetical protein GCM10009768_26330 [Leucobacter iarius]|uniref:histidine kinase n=1 Tax=Leucobacter iarius TaxID=333963 RepID=A0ABN2LPU5_9MICO
MRDLGPGVPEGERERLFDRFYRSHSARRLPGSGLGLALVQQIAHEPGAQLQAAWPEDSGTEMRVVFPVGGY